MWKRPRSALSCPCRHVKTATCQEPRRAVTGRRVADAWVPDAQVHGPEQGTQVSRFGPSALRWLQQPARA